MDCHYKVAAAIRWGKVFQNAECNVQYAVARALLPNSLSSFITVLTLAFPSQVGLAEETKIMEVK